MAKHTTSFVIGALIGGVGAAAAVIWNAPQSGETTRNQISDAIEAVLFSVLSADDATDARILSHQAPTPAPSSTSPAAEPV